jgi:hypothetical protein
MRCRSIRDPHISIKPSHSLEGNMAKKAKKAKKTAKKAAKKKKSKKK